MGHVCVLLNVFQPINGGLLSGFSPNPQLSVSHPGVAACNPLEQAPPHQQVTGCRCRRLSGPSSSLAPSATMSLMGVATSPSA